MKVASLVPSEVSVKQRLAKVFLISYHLYQVAR